jgi:hypothetical protein
MQEVAGYRAWIALTDTSYVEAVWYVEMAGGNWLACVYRDADGAPWKMTYRLRWYADGKLEGSADRRAGGEVTAVDSSDASRDELVAGADHVSRSLEDEAHGKRWQIVVRGRADAFQAAMRQAPWSHTSTIDLTKHRA